jgi:hypothetical protein
LEWNKPVSHLREPSNQQLTQDGSHQSNTWNSERLQGGGIVAAPPILIWSAKNLGGSGSRVQSEGQINRNNIRSQCYKKKE